MEYQKIINLLDTKSDDNLKFMTRKWVEGHDQSNKIYNTNQQIRFKTSMLQSDLCDFSDAYIIDKGPITAKWDDNRDIKNRSLAFKSNAPFIGCISRSNNVLIDNAEDLDVVMPTYNLIEYSKSYIKTTDSLCNYYRDKPNHPPFNSPVNNNPPTVIYNADSITNSASFKYKSTIIEKTIDNNDDNANNYTIIIEIFFFFLNFCFIKIFR